ncbi:hypothetical protein ACFLXC_06690, partial [Chloroflexota bacterium]
MDGIGKLRLSSYTFPGVEVETGVGEGEGVGDGGVVGEGVAQLAKTRKVSTKTTNTTVSNCFMLVILLNIVHIYIYLDIFTIYCRF